MSNDENNVYTSYCSSSPAPAAPVVLETGGHELTLVVEQDTPGNVRFFVSWEVLIDENEAVVGGNHSFH